MDDMPERVAMPRLTADLPGTGGRIRGEIEDFQVTEIPLYEPSGEGTHTYLWVEKRGIPTMELVHRMGRALGRHARDFGMAGLKDARAVARQWVSVEHVELGRATGLVGDGWRVLSAGLHRNKLKIGHLRGNAFRLLIRDARPGSFQAAKAVLDHLTTEGVPNIFGPQRFGLRGDTHLMGRALIVGDWREFCDLLLGRPRDTDPPVGRRMRSLYEAGKYFEARRAAPPGHREHVAVLDGLLRSKGDHRRATWALPKGMRRLFVSAWQSALFNEVVARRMPELGQLMGGDLAYLHDRGAVFRVEDAPAEQTRADRFEISPTGPLFGQRMTSPEGRPGEIEAEVLAASGVGQAALKGGHKGELRGGRRPLRVPLEGAEAEEAADGLWVSFRLPAGCYATTVLDEIMKVGEAGRNEDDSAELEE